MGGGNPVSDFVDDTVSSVREGLQDARETISQGAKDTLNSVGIDPNNSTLKYAGDWMANLGKSYANMATFGLAGDLADNGRLDKNFSELGQSFTQGATDVLTGGAATTVPAILEEEAMKDAARSAAEADAQAKELESLNRPFYDAIGFEQRRARLASGMYGYGSTILTSATGTLGSLSGTSRQTGG